MTNTASRVAPASRVVRISALVQPLALPRMIAHTSASRPALASSTPGASIGRWGPWLSSNTRGDRIAAATPMGTLIQKIQCQLIPWTITPPTTGPTATAEPVIAPQIPIALPRWPGGNAAETSARLSGEISAAPAP